MKISHPLSFLSLSLALLLISCSDAPQVIPRKTLADIYAEMFVTDEWLQDNRSKVNRLADTSFVYAAILEKYGYDADDYLFSVEKYLADPERFSRILRDTEAKLKNRAEALKSLKAEQERLRRLELRRDSIIREWSISLDSMNKSFVVPVEADTVVFELLTDSLNLKAFPGPLASSTDSVACAVVVDSTAKADVDVAASLDKAVSDSVSIEKCVTDTADVAAPVLDKQISRDIKSDMTTVYKKMF